MNLITNSMLTLLRHPREFQKLRDDPERVSLVVEEVLRYDPPVQFVQRFALTDITMRGSTIPQGSGIWLMLAAGDRDPAASLIPASLTRTAPTTSTLASAMASITVWARRSPASRRISRSESSLVGWSIHAWSSIPPPIDQMPCYEVPNICPLPLITWSSKWK